MVRFSGILEVRVCQLPLLQEKRGLWLTIISHSDYIVFTIRKNSFMRWLRQYSSIRPRAGIFYLTASLSTFPAQNAGTRAAGMVIASLVGDIADFKRRKDGV
ncbi:hypothetical protein SGGMMB4_05914 (plasmid) [Sodalis glossinidius str. 'morsitans']|uniref:Uncharacterized protein n=2 Tax=Sodalis glossinidius TaxID=63612 RepID=A0A193QP50_SODGM|nr:hypothetical protein pSG4.03 [Sodalis glossinidius]CAI59432.1 hypothetical protein pSG4.03 [Sodalis glossinidius]CRL46942.1 hypothetical protein SGGMMB4_05914 [Sodalis glossinidius str. 'morsitans']